MTGRVCGCPDTPHQHGCRNRYRRGCHCDLCRAAVARIRRNHRHRYYPTTSEQSRNLDEDIAWLGSFHMSDERIAAQLGLSVNAVRARRRR